MGGEDADGRTPRRRWRGGRLLLTLALLVVAGLVAWSLVSDGGEDDTDTDDPLPTDVALLGPDLTAAGLRLDDDGDPPSRALGMLRTHLAEVDAQERTAHITLGTSTSGMELARFAVLWCDMPPEASQGIQVPHGTITVHDVTLEVPCAGTDGTPPVRGMVALPLAGTAILEVTGDLPSAGSATLAIYTEPTDGASVPVFLGEDVPPPAVPPGALVVDDEHALPDVYATTRSRLVQVGPDSQIRVHASSAGVFRVDVDGVPVTDDGDLAARERFYDVLGSPDAGGTELEELLEETRSEQWRTQQPDLRNGQWFAHAPGTRTFPLPAAFRPEEGQQRTVAVSVIVEADQWEAPQVVVTHAAEPGPEDVADLTPLPLDAVDDLAPRYLQGARLAAAWTVPQDGVLRALPDLPEGQVGPTWLTATWPGPDPGLPSADGLGMIETGSVLTDDELVPLLVVDTSRTSYDQIGLDGPDQRWSMPVEDRWRQPEGEAAVVLPPVPGLADATVLAYEPVAYEDFDFTDAPPSSMSFHPDAGPAWSAPRILETLTEADLEDGLLTLEVGRDADMLWITTRGPGRMELLRDDEPLPWGSPDGWWSSWTDQAVTTEVPFEPRRGTLQVRVEGYDEGFRIEVRGPG